MECRGFRVNNGNIRKCNEFTNIISITDGITDGLQGNLWKYLWMVYILVLKKPTDGASTIPKIVVIIITKKRKKKTSIASLETKLRDVSRQKG